MALAWASKRRRTALLAAYEQLNREKPIRDLRLSVSHSNFMTRETVEQAARLGVVLDIQPIWLYLDARTLANQFGYDRLRWFQPLKSIFAAGGVAGGPGSVSVGERAAAKLRVDARSVPAGHAALRR